MLRTLLVLAGLTLATAHATTLPPELKAYDFAEAYYIEDGGVVISPYQHGFVCTGGIETPEGIRLMPGQTFRQYDPAHLIVEEYHFTKLPSDERRAFFHEELYHYRVETDAKGHHHFIRQELVAKNDFYLSRWRSLEFTDHVFTNVELHPGEQEWRVSKN